ncbi:hypothetical protein RBB84_22590 [Rhodococcus sp. D-6]|uniref:DUF222 domain-containing protein n=1 Tax=Rhodococcus sp. D-6 TaxID=1387842 RepID=A0AAU7UXN6_9NOCA|nr:hypothetical protein [Rhodococcus sp. HS-D2]
MSVSHRPVGTLLDAFVAQLPRQPTADRRIDRTARIVAATVAAVQASLDAPLKALRSEARTRLTGHPAPLLPEPDLEVTCSTALFGQVCATVSDASSLMTRCHHRSTWAVLAAAAADLRTLTRLVTSPLVDAGSILAVDSLRAENMLSDHIAQILGVDTHPPAPPVEYPMKDSREGSGRSVVDELIRSVRAVTDTETGRLPASAVDVHASPDRIDYPHDEPTTVAQACVALDLLTHATTLLCARLAELYCDDQWTTREAEIADAIDAMKNRVWPRAESTSWD